MFFCSCLGAGEKVCVRQHKMLLTTVQLLTNVSSGNAKEIFSVKVQTRG